MLCVAALWSLIQLLLFATVVNVDQTANVKSVHYLGWPAAPKAPAGRTAFCARLWLQEGRHERKSKLWSPVMCLAGTCLSRNNLQSLILGGGVDSLTGPTFGDIAASARSIQASTKTPDRTTHPIREQPSMLPPASGIPTEDVQAT